MDKEKIEQIEEALDELEWDDEEIPILMEGFYNNVTEALDLDKCTEEHLESIYNLLELEEEGDGEDEKKKNI